MSLYTIITFYPLHLEGCRRDDARIKKKLNE